MYWNNGVIEGGSSGAPVFLDANKRVVATISGGPDYDCNSRDWHDWVGKVRECNAIKNILFDGSSSESYEGIDPIMACQSHIELYGTLRDARLYRAAKHNIHIQAGQTATFSNLGGTTVSSGSSYTVTAGQKITLLPDNGGTHIEVGAIASLHIASCITGTECGVNYNKSGQVTEEPVFDEENHKVTDRPLILYPNPVVDFLYLDTEVKIKKWFIIDMHGRKLRDGTDIRGGISAEVLAPGMYMLHYETSEGDYGTEKFIKK